MAVVNETKHNGKPHEFQNLGNKKKQGKNALIFDVYVLYLIPTNVKCQTIILQ